jgi:hypothetical protein
MKKQKQSILVLAMISFTILFFLRVNVLGGESIVPPPPDKNKTLPANDGGPDGCNSSRFKCVMGGEAVLDKQTVKFCQDLEIGNQKGWRLPTKEELITLLDTSRSNPALPEGHPFENYTDPNTPDSAYWTGTTYEGNSNSAYYIYFSIGSVRDELKIFDARIWPVLGGK